MNNQTTLLAALPHASDLPSDPTRSRTDTAQPGTGSSPEALTRAASLQTYVTIRFLVDRGRARQAFQAYAYFRWLDDALDRPEQGVVERAALTTRQADLIERLYRGETVADLTAEERWLAELIASDPSRPSGLEAYIRHLLAVMAFDTRRRGLPISAGELAAYTHHLAAGVTEAMHYFIGHGRATPSGALRYRAVTGAHITHMLRDTYDDLAAGYINIPAEVLTSARIGPDEIDSPPYRAWVEQRVRLARACFDDGKRYLSALACRRCRVAGFAYTRRFEQVLDQIERDGFRLRRSYPDGVSVADLVRLGAEALQRAWQPTPIRAVSRA